MRLLVALLFIFPVSVIAQKINDDFILIGSTGEQFKNFVNNTLNKELLEYDLRPVETPTGELIKYEFSDRSFSPFSQPISITSTLNLSIFMSYEPRSQTDFKEFIRQEYDHLITRPGVGDYYRINDNSILYHFNKPGSFARYYILPTDSLPSK